jgi:hypothetical protein
LGASVGMAVENAVIESAQQKSVHPSTALFSPQDGFGFGGATCKIFTCRRTSP